MVSHPQSQTQGELELSEQPKPITCYGTVTLYPDKLNKIQQRKYTVVRQASLPTNDDKISHHFQAGFLPGQFSYCISQTQNIYIQHYYYYMIQ